MASTEPPQPVKHKTCVLRVSIHCEGCKRKVSKILRSVPGVQHIEIERQNHRVLVTGDVSPENLVRKLMKSGKHAELWPENPPQNHIRRTEKSHGNEESAVSGKEIKPPETKTETPTVEFAASRTEIKPPATKAEVPAVDSSKPANPIVQSGVSPAGNGGGKVVDVGAKVAVEVKTEEKKPGTGSVSDSPSPSVVQKEEKQTGNDGGVAAGGVGGSGEKKKKKKKKEGQNSNITSSIGEKSSSSPRQQTTNRSFNQSPPRQHGYKYPAPHHHVPPPAPVYTMSYNTAHPPVNSYTASYRAAAPPPPQSYAYSHFGPPMAPPPQSYAYSHFGPPMAPPPPPPLSEYHSYTQQPVDSFEMFSDENPNGCLVM